MVKSWCIKSRKLEGLVNSEVQPSNLRLQRPAVPYHKTPIYTTGTKLGGISSLACIHRYLSDGILVDEIQSDLMSSAIPLV